jgi:hypothetical protein
MPISVLGQRLRRLVRGPAAILCVTALTAFALATPANAVCAICNAAVRFNSDLATCFQDRVDSELTRLKSEGRGFVIVDLSDCEAAAGIRGGLPIGIDTKRSLPLDSSFVADSDSLECLREAIVANAGELDPSFLFDLNKLCP